MCDLEKNRDAWPHGQGFRLCSTPANCLPGLLGYDDNGTSQVLPEAIGSFFECDLAVVEYDYFDLDYRSEFTATHETSFATRENNCRRLHFFRKARFNFARAPSLWDLINVNADRYSGYIILRPQKNGVVGRSMIPPQAPPNELWDVSESRNRIRTAVTEHITLFGIALEVYGVPFMEQDGHLLRCIHAAAWMSHYTSSLRGLVPRRASGEFHAAEDPTNSYGRNYPSLGLSLFSLTPMLRILDLPPEVNEVQRVWRRPFWFDLPEVWAVDKTVNNLGVSPTEPSFDELDTEIQDFWIREYVTSTVCRYLNSGLPVIILRTDLEHAYIACGYLRDHHMADSRPKDGRVALLLVQDDQRGPYCPLPVETLVQLAQDGELVLVTPLPAGLWLAGDRAELAAASVFIKAVIERGDKISQIAGLAGRELVEFMTVSGAPSEWCTEGDNGRRTRYEIRSYASLGSDFKRGFVKRVGCSRARQVASYRPMPKYVWVSEIIDRQLRDEVSVEQSKKGRPFVRGTVVLDASSTAETFDELSALLLVDLPGQITDAPYVGGIGTSVDQYADKLWTRTDSINAYPSGRWDYDHWMQASDATQARSKNATSNVR
jgi:hypothetical protein